MKNRRNTALNLIFDQSDLSPHVGTLLTNWSQLITSGTDSRQVSVVPKPFSRWADQTCWESRPDSFDIQPEAQSL